MRISRHHGFPEHGTPSVYWLGQAGFWIDTGAYRVLIDPYLSDSLAKKYAGQVNDHKRLMSPPITVDQLPMPDIVLVTHAHTDHMDPETLGPLVQRFPNLPFVIPRAERDTAQKRIGQNAKLLSVTDGEIFSPLPGLDIHVFPAAHETLQRDQEGDAVFLGYGIEANGLKLYHSGNSIPFDGIENLLRRFAPDVALLPVNGRDEQRLASGIPGNFTLEEAINLCKDVGIGWMIPHHFGMFAFNTISEAAIDDATTVTFPTIVKPVVGERLDLEFDGRAGSASRNH